MLLSPSESDRFLSLYKPLLCHGNQLFPILKRVKTIADLEASSFSEFYQLRENLYEHLDVFDSFVRDRLSSSDPEAIPIVEAWKNQHVRGKFCLLRHLKNYSIFLSLEEPNKAYGVLGLTTPLKDMPLPVPTILQTVLLPFSGKVVTDGLIGGGRILLGSGMRRSFNTAYEEAKARFGLITSLDQPIVATENADAARLKAYLKTERSREEYWDEIAALKAKSPELQQLYTQEMGKVYAKTYSKRYREIGLKDLWVALFEEMPIATGTTQAEVAQIIRRILPQTQQAAVHIFQVKGK